MDKKMGFQIDVNISLNLFKNQGYIKCLISHCLKMTKKLVMFWVIFLALKSPLQNFCVRIIACLDVDQTFWQGTFHVCLCVNIIFAFPQMFTLQTFSWYFSAILSLCASILWVHTHIDIKAYRKTRWNDPFLARKNF